MQEAKNMTYNDEFLNRIKAIPILDICQVLNIEVVDRGRPWCRLRNERTPSTLLNTDTVPNSYIDFGGRNKRSDVIQFVCDATGCSTGDAIRYLAEKFNITRDKRGNSLDLANWEYEKLGLYGDLATKNFTFDLERQSFERVAELSEKYGMPMNELRRKHPKIYEQLLRDKALPQILPQINFYRKDYYLSLLSLHENLKTTDFTQYPSLRHSLMESIKNLQGLERVWVKATEKTSIQAYPVGDYHPETDIKKILSGELNPSFGSHNKKQMLATAEAKRCAVKYRTIPFTKFGFRELDAYQHSAFYKSGQIVVGYLETDHAALKPLFDKMTGKEPLKDKITNAEAQKQSNASCVGPSVQHEPAR